MTSTVASHPRVVVLALIAAGIMAGLIAGFTMFTPRGASADGHITGLENVVVDSIVVDHELGTRTSRKQVRIWGSGFAPGQEVILMVNDGPGTPSDITAFTSHNVQETGTIVANDRGAWTTVWTLGRFTRPRSGIGPGDGDVERMRALSVVDPGTFDVITSTPLAFCRVSDRMESQAGIAAMDVALHDLRDEIAALGDEAPAGVSESVWMLVMSLLEAEAMERAAAIEAAVGEHPAIPQHCSA